MSIAPRATVEIIYEGVDISRDIAPDLIDFTYNDNEGGKSDDISIKLKNNHGRWTNEWLPVEGDTIRATIIQQTASGTTRLFCGTFTVDEIKENGPPSQVEINAVSVPINNSIRRQKKSRAWESVTLSEIAADMANTGRLELLYRPEEPGAVDPTYERKDQSDETDLQFLQRLCDDSGLKLKVTDSQLVIFNPEYMQTLPEVVSLTKGQSAILSWSFETQAHDVYKSVTVEYLDAMGGAVNKYTYTDPDGDIRSDKEFKVTKRVESISEAESLAKSTLFAKNRLQTKGSMTLFGDTRITTGITMNVSGFGKFSGKYYTANTKHSVSGGYKVSVDLIQSKG